MIEEGNRIGLNKSAQDWQYRRKIGGKIGVGLVKVAQNWRNWAQDWQNRGTINEIGT